MSEQNPPGRWPKPRRNTSLEGWIVVEEGIDPERLTPTVKGKVKVGEGVGRTHVNVRPTMHQNPPFWTRPPDQTSAASRETLTLIEIEEEG